MYGNRVPSASHHDFCNAPNLPTPSNIAVATNRAVPFRIAVDHLASSVAMKCAAFIQDMPTP